MQILVKKLNRTRAEWLDIADGEKSCFLQQFKQATMQKIIK